MSHHFYTTLATYYDKIYGHHDSILEAGFLIKVIDNYLKSDGKKLLDLCCGTGNHGDLLQKKGFTVTGVDLNEEMLEQARKKNSEVQYIKDDMKKLSIENNFDIIVCFLNGILYNQNLSELKKTLAWCFDHLNKGGVLIFDAFDKVAAMIDQKEDTLIYKDEETDMKYFPEWTYDTVSNRLNLKIEFDLNGKKIIDLHQMGAFSLDEIVSTLEGIGFKVSLLERKFEEVLKYSGEYYDAVFVCNR